MRAKFSGFLVGDDGFGSSPMRKPFPSDVSCRVRTNQVASQVYELVISDTEIESMFNIDPDTINHA